MGRVAVCRRWSVGHREGQGPRWWLVAFVWIGIVGGGCGTVYLNKWAVEIMGGSGEADRVAEEYGFRNLGQIGSLENYYLFEQRRLVKRSTTPSRHHHFQLKKAPEVIWVEQQSVKRRFKREYKVELDRWKPRLNDPVWSEMWYLNQGARGGHDMNVLGAWKLGYTGKGVVVTILDDGIEHSHSDLQQNYDPDASFDINDNDIDPTPRYDKADENRHGTRCAGEVAAVANNSRCGVGVAFRSRIGGVRMLDGDVVDAVEAQALSFNPQHVDIYSASWGPEDNGKLVDGPATLAREAFVKGVLTGRGGKGSIYVWASGNGGSASDSCGCDGYANSIYTLSVSSTSEFGTKPWYLEECSSTLATTYSSGENYKERKIVTTDLHDRCIDNHTGTSASAPLAAGMCALALEANPDLTWRDMQHIVLMTSRSEPLRDAQWVVNGAGRLVSHRYGYGLMDGQAMVLLAEKWTTVPEQRTCTTNVITVDRNIEGSGISVTFDTDGCKDSDNEINYLEHVQARISLAYSRRGDLQIHLVSPNGTRSTLLPRRKQDYQFGEFGNWSFMSVFYWGEQPQGTWTLVLENVGSQSNSGIFEKWQLVMFGTNDDPVNLKDTTPQRPLVKLSTDGESTTGFDLDNFVTLSGLNASESHRSNSTSSTPTRLRPTITKKLRPKPGSKSTTPRIGKTTVVKTTATPDHVLSSTVKVVLITDVTHTSSVILKENVTLQRIGSESVTSLMDDTEVWDSTTKSIAIKSDVSDEVLLNKTEKDLVLSDGITTQLSNFVTIAAEKETSIPFICDVECTAEGCFGPGPENCFACQHARFNNQCTSLCPNTTFYDSESKTCRSCLFPCIECTHSTAENKQNCTSCEPDYLLNVEGNSTICVDLCPLGYYADFDQSRCLPCIPNCLVCVDDPGNCLRCEDDFEFVNSICTDACELSEYREEDGSCQSCDDSCEMCIGPDSMDCLTCAVGMVHENDICVANCSEGYYLDSNLMCEMCHPSCSACFGPEDNECFSCYHPLKFFSLSCLDDCPVGHFEDNDETCHVCDESCSACIGPRENDCLDCSPTSFYFDGRCASSCPEGLFPVEVYNHVTEGLTNRCEVCHGTCQTCSGGSAVDCIRCFKGLVLSSGRCIGSCEHHKYREDDRCWDCHVTCAACYGPLDDHCLECQSDRFLLGGQCLTDCPHGYYQMDGQCLFCSIECSDCSDYGADNCAACSNGYTMRDGVCVVPLSALDVTCAAKQFYNTAEQKCEMCHDLCQTCSGSTPYHCLSCLIPKMLHLESGRCLPCCVDVDATQDVAQCCTCDHIVGICVEVWDNLRPELTPISNMSTSRPVNFSSSVILSSTSEVHPSSSNDSAFIPASKSFSTKEFPSSSGRFSPSKSKTKTSTSASSPFDFKTSSTVSSTVNVNAVEITDGERQWTKYFLTATTKLPSSRSMVGFDVTENVSDVGFWSPWVLVLFFAICFGSVCVIALIVVFCIVRAKGSDKLCWSKRHYHPVPVVFQGAQPTNPGKPVDAVCQV